MKAKITTLVENAVGTSQGLIGEHGLSFLVEYDDGKLLFDTGQGMTLLNNAVKMGFCPQDFKRVVLSHGHYDHAGGLKMLVESGARFELIAHPDAFAEKVAMFPGKGFIPIGNPVNIEYLKESGITVKIVSESIELAPGIMTTGEVPMKTDFEKIEPMLFVRENGKEIPDPLADDQALILDTDKGIVVLLGCAHRGVVNTLMRVQELTGKTTVYAVVGGFHLERASDAQVRQTVDVLKEFDVRQISPAHCTGIRATKAFLDAFGNRITTANVGFTLSCS